MLLDSDVLRYAHLLDDDAAPGDAETSALDSSLVEYAHSVDDDDQARKKYLRDKYVWGLASEWSGVRRQHALNAAREIDSPQERQFLLDETLKVRKAMEWTERAKYKQSGFFGRWRHNLGEAGKAYVEAGEGIRAAAIDLATNMATSGQSRDDIEFMMGVEAASQSTTFRLSGARGLTQQAATGMAGVAPDMAAGMAAGVGAGPTGMFAYWTLRQAPEQIRNYTAMGIDQPTAALAGYGTAGASAAIELFNYDPTGALSSGGRSLVSGATQVAANIAKETLEEPWQATTESGVQYLIGRLYPGAEGLKFADVARAPGRATTEVLPTMVGLGLTFGGAGKMRIMENSRIEREILESTRSGQPVTRKQWSRWGLGEGGETQEARTKHVQAIAERLQTREQVEHVATRTPPTEAQWASWGFPPELGETPEARLEALDCLTLAGAVIEARELAPEAPRAAAARDEASPPAEVLPAPPLEGGVDVHSVAKVEDGGDFITDTSGSIGVRVAGITSAVKRGVDRAGHLLRKFFTSAGELPAEAFDAIIAQRGEFASMQGQVAFTLNEANAALRSLHGTDVLTQAQRVALRPGLHERGGTEGVPDPVRGVMRKMRDQIDALSRAAREEGVAQGELAAVVEQNEGIYVTRGYRKFDDSKYGLKVPDRVKNALVAAIRENYPDYSEAQVHGLIAHLLYEGSAEAKPMQAVSEAGLLAEDLSVLKRRVLDASPELRALYGEYDDFRVEYARTVMKLGNLIAQHRMFVRLREAGIARGFFSPPEVGPVVNEFGELKALVNVRADVAAHPLNGMYTTPEILEALTEARGEMPEWLRLYSLGNAVAKTAKTVLSPMTHVRNVTANVSFAIQNGHWNAKHATEAWRATTTELRGKGTEEQKAAVLRYRQLGLIGEEVHAGELREYIRDFDKYNEFDDFAYDAGTRRAHRTKQITRKFLKTLQTMYTLEDAIWKVYAFENERARYRAAIPLSEMSDAELDQRAAGIVRNTYPTFSMVPRGVKGLRRFPLVGTFVSFPSEVVRTSYHSLKLSMEEMADPRLRKIGATRFVGNTVVLSGQGAAALAIGLRMLHGVSKGDDDDLRFFVAPWQRNSVFAHLGRTPAGDYRFVDLGYSDPHNILHNPFQAFLRGEDLKSSLWGALKEASGQFLGMEMLAGALIEAHDNPGFSVRNPEASMLQQAASTTQYIYDRAFKPGAQAGIERIAAGVMGKKSKTGYAYDPLIETVKQMTGVNIQTVDIARSLRYRMLEFRSRRDSANRLLGSVALRGGSVSGTELGNAYIDSEKARRGIIEYYAEIVSAARRQRVGEDELVALLSELKLGKADTQMLLTGTYQPRVLSKQFYAAMYDANSEEYDLRVAAIRAAEKMATSEK